MGDSVGLPLQFPLEVVQWVQVRWVGGPGLTRPEVRHSGKKKVLDLCAGAESCCKRDGLPAATFHPRYYHIAKDIQIHFLIDLLALSREMWWYNVTVTGQDTQDHHSSRLLCSKYSLYLTLSHSNPAIIPCISGAVNGEKFLIWEELQMPSRGTFQLIQYLDTALQLDFLHLCC